MERFVFVVAIAVAVLFGLGAMFGGPHFNFDVEFDGGPPEGIVETTPGRMEPQAFQGDSLDVRHVAAVITITPEDRSDFLVEIDNQAGRAPLPHVSSEHGSVVIDGRLRGRIADCRDDGGAELRGYGELAVAELPRINIRAPRDLDIDRGGAGTTEIGAAQSLSIEVSGCSINTAGDVAGGLDVELAGSGQVRTGAVRSADISIAGSGTVATGAVAEGAEVEIAGSGKVNMASLAGDISFDGAGSGGLNVEGGAIDTAEIDIAGSSDVSIAAPIQTLNVDIVGSGDVETGVVGDLEADIAGSGDVRVQAVTGTSQREVWGSGEVIIGAQPPQPPTPPEAPAAPAQSAPAAPSENAP